MTAPVALSDIETAADRLAGRIRRTPLVDLVSTTTAVTEGDLLVKLENLQISGSFKVLGHAGAIISGSSGTAEEKTKAFEENGIAVAKRPVDIVGLIQGVLPA